MRKILFPKHSIIRVNTLPSTNTYAQELIKNKSVTSNAVILAQNQFRGRGQQANVWESEDSKNLTISIVLYADFLPAQYQFYLSMVIALSVYDYLKSHLQNVFVKWPNDIYVNNDKIGGILIENSVSGGNIKYSVCGIGLNINQQKFYSDAPNPISLTNCTGDIYNLEEVFNELLLCVENRYQQLEQHQLDVLLKDYLNVLYRKGEQHRFEDENGVFEGVIVGITAIGQLRIKTKDKERIYNFKEVKFLK